MTKQKPESIGKVLKFQLTDKKIFTRNIIIGSLLATFISMTPFIFYLYELVPQSDIWETWLFTFKGGFYGSAQVAAWTLMMKVIPLALLIIWFFTCRHWWYHSILVPIAMYTYQIFGAINQEIDYVDEFQLIHLLPIMAIVIPSIYLIRAKIFNSINTINKTTQQLEDELAYKPKDIWEKIKQYF